MQKEEIKKRVEDLSQSAKTKIEGNPLAAFFVGLLLGFLIGNNKDFFIPLIGLCCAIAAVLYFWLWSTKSDK